MIGKAVVVRSLRVMAVVLLLVGIIFISWYLGAGIAASHEQASLSRELDAIAGTAATAAPRHRPALPLRGLVGRIEVPRLKLSAIAREGADVRTLRRAIGHIPGTAFPGDAGNAAFAAHRDTFFRPLQSIRKGDEVVVTTTSGVYRYSVTGTQVVEPEDVSVLDPTPGTTLTLVTCYPFDFVGSAPQRFIVSASLLK
ncbi:MAG: class D sortase [Vicinamibacterales bacterium]